MSGEYITVHESSWFVFLSSDMRKYIIVKDFFSTEVKQKLSNIAADTTLDAITRARLYTNIIFDNLTDNLEKNVEDFIKLQYIHPEVKNSLLHKNEKTDRRRINLFRSVKFFQSSEQAWLLRQNI